MRINHNLLDSDISHFKYEEQGIGQPLLFLHGFSLDSLMWDPVWQRIPNTYRKIRYDARGFGKSFVPHKQYSHSEDCVNIIKTHSIKKPVIIGFSMGGTTALDLAITHPDKISKLILISTAIGGYKGSVDWTVHKQGQSLDVTKTLWQKHPIFRTGKNHSNVQKQLKVQVENYSGWHWVQSDPKVFPKPVALESMHTIAVPTMIICGDHDLPDFQNQSVILEQSIRGSVYKKYIQCGHMVPLEDPELLVRDILRFLST